MRSIRILAAGIGVAVGATGAEEKSLGARRRVK
jgi:hypothetical protein